MTYTPRFRKALLFTLPFLLAALFATAGCDAIAEKIGVDEVEVSLGEVGRNIPVAPGARAKSEDVDRGGSDLPDAFDVESITVAEEDVTFTPAISKHDAAQNNGTIDLFLIVDRAPAIGFSATVEAGVVTAISPNTVSLGRYDKDAFAGCLDQVPTEERPALREGYASLSSSQTEDIVSSAVKQPSFPMSVMACVSGDLVGTLGISQVTFNLDF